MSASPQLAKPATLPYRYQPSERLSAEPLLVDACKPAYRSSGIATPTDAARMVRVPPRRHATYASQIGIANSPAVRIVVAIPRHNPLLARRRVETGGAPARYPH